MESKISSNEQLGNKVISKNEVYYLLSSNEDKKLIINGFIDKLEVYEKHGIYTARVIDYKTNKITSNANLDTFTNTYKEQLLLYGKAIKELIYIDGNKIDNIDLKIYFLDSKDVISIDYEDEAANNLLRNIDDCFYKLSTGTSIEDYPIVYTHDCKKCNYVETCNTLL